MNGERKEREKEGIEVVPVIHQNKRDEKSGKWEIEENGS